MMRRYKLLEEVPPAEMVPEPGYCGSCLERDHGNGMLPMAAWELLVGYSVILEEIWSDSSLVILGSVRFEEQVKELSLELDRGLTTLKVAVLSDQVCYCFCFDCLPGL